MNSLPRMNKHIRFPSTSSSTPSADVVVKHRSTAPLMETTEPIIQDEFVSPSPQTDNVPPMPTPMKTTTLHQDNQEECNSNFQIFVLSQLSIFVQLT